MPSPRLWTPVPQLREDTLRHGHPRPPGDEPGHSLARTSYPHPLYSTCPAAKELRDGLLQDEFLSQISQDVLKSFAMSELRAKRRTESLASQAYRVQKDLLGDNHSPETCGKDQRNGSSSQRPAAEYTEKQCRKPFKDMHPKELPSSVTSISTDNPILADEVDRRIKALGAKHLGSRNSLIEDDGIVPLHNEQVTLFDLAASGSSTGTPATTSSLAETLSLFKMIADTKDSTDIEGMLRNLYEDRDILQHSINKSPDTTSARMTALKAQLTDNQKLIQACLMALQQKVKVPIKDQLGSSQYIRAYLSSGTSTGANITASMKRPRHKTNRQAPPITAGIRPASASTKPCGERFIPEYVDETVRDPVMDPMLNTVHYLDSREQEKQTDIVPNDMYYRTASAPAFPILAQSRMNKSMQNQRPFGEGCAYLPTMDQSNNDCMQAQDIDAYNKERSLTKQCEGPMFSNLTAPKTRPIGNILDLHRQMFSPHAMQAFASGSNVIKLACPDCLTMAQENCRYIGNIVEPLLIVGGTVLDLQQIHRLREKLAKCFIYEPDGLPISPAERNFVWTLLCFILYSFPESIFIGRNGNILHSAHFIIPFDLAFKPTHVLLEASIISLSTSLRSYAVANVAIPYFSNKPALPKATRLEAITKYQRRIHFSIDRIRYCLNKSARAVAAYLRRTTDVLE